MGKEIQLTKILRRELQGKTLSKVAKEVGISVSVLHDWHSSGRWPSAKNLWQLKLLADHLGLSLEEILFGRTSQAEVIGSMPFSVGGRHYRVKIEKIGPA
jgi:transcriptional regulator with XRE-family HTH domain